MSWLIVSDIFGRTDALEGFASSLEEEYSIIDPYEGKRNRFADEESAYHTFSNEVGLDRYFEMVLECLSNASMALNLVGFSVGASAIWHASNKIDPLIVKSACCFYGSQIRNFTEITPKFHISMVLPRLEEHFSIHTLSDVLSNKDNVSVKSSSYLHGFMNKLSHNFEQNEYNRYVEVLRKHAI